MRLKNCVQSNKFQINFVLKKAKNSSLEIKDISHFLLQELLNWIKCKKNHWKRMNLFKKKNFKKINYKLKNIKIILKNKHLINIKLILSRSIKKFMKQEISWEEPSEIQNLALSSVQNVSLMFNNWLPISFINQNKINKFRKDN